MAVVKIDTEIFAMSHKRFAWVMTILYGKPWLLTVSIILACGIILGLTVDLVWGLSCLFLVLLIVPLGMMYLYYSYALRNPSFVNVLPHKILFSNRSLSVVVYNNEKPKENEEKEDFNNECIYSREIDYADFGGKFIFPDGMALKTIRPEKGFLWIAPHYFWNEECFKDAMEILISAD